MSSKWCHTRSLRSTRQCQSDGEQMNQHTCCHRWTSASVGGVEGSAERQPTADGGALRAN